MTLNRTVIETLWRKPTLVNNVSDFACLAFPMSPQFELSIQLFHSFVCTVVMMSNCRTPHYLENFLNNTLNTLNTTFYPLCTQVVCCTSVVVTTLCVVFFGVRCSKLNSIKYLVTLSEQFQNPIQVTIVGTKGIIQVLLPTYQVYKCFIILNNCAIQNCKL
jgi:hypothetical protein